MKSHKVRQPDKSVELSNLNIVEILLGNKLAFIDFTFYRSREKRQILFF